VFGTRTGATVARFLREGYRESPDSRRHLEEARQQATERIEGFCRMDGPERLASVRDELKDKMMRKCGVFRVEADLLELTEELRVLRERFQKTHIEDKGRRFNTELLEMIELDHLLEVSQIMVAGALARKESRGGHARKDYPQRDDVNFLKHTLAYRTEDGTPQLRYKPVTITKYQPQERKY